MTQLRNAGLLLTLAVSAVLLAACSGKPMVPYTTDEPPYVMVPVAQAGIDDQRGRFREVLCAVFDAHGDQLPDPRPCDDVLTRVGTEPPATGEPVNVDMFRTDLLIAVVPGLGWDCFENWLDWDQVGLEHLRQFGLEGMMLDVDGLSGTETNARMIRDQIMNLPEEFDGRRVILAGYSKGSPDILEALVSYPELSERVVAMISIAGAVGGSALATNASQSQANLLTNFPNSDCDEGDGRAVRDLRPVNRKTWLAENTPLPDAFRYYSIVTYPDPERMSSALKGNYDKLAKVDARNDSQVIFYDQIIPGGTLVAFVNADHWAIAVPIAREHSFVGSVFVDQNEFPREAFFEGVVRFLEEDLLRNP